MERIPVRNHGRISVAESLALQVTENEARVDPHPVDTAVSYQLLVEEAGMSQATIARVAGRSAAHISYMRAVGEAAAHRPAWRPRPRTGGAAHGSRPSAGPGSPGRRRPRR